MRDLTVKQEAFAMAYVECGNASEAYRQSYDAGNMSDPAIWEEAKRLQNNPLVALRVKELRDVIRDAHTLTVADLIRELEEARTAALTAETAQSSAAVSATMGKARILGLDKQTLALTGADGGAIETHHTIEFIKANGGN